MANRTLNFDNFMAEKKAEYIDVTVFGKQYKVKREIPAIMPIMMARANESTKREEVMLSILRAGDIMFGEKAIDTFCENGMSSDMLAELIQQTFNMISSEDVDGDDLDEETFDDESGKVVSAKGKKTKK